MKKKKLTPKQAAFVAEYPIDYNLTQAAIRAGYSPRTAYAIGEKLLKKIEIKEEIQKILDCRSERVEIKQDDVLREDMKIAFSDLRKIYDPNGCMIAPPDLPEEVARSISSFEVIETVDKDGHKTTKYKYRFWDKSRAIERMYKHLGLFAPEKLEHSGKIDTHTGVLIVPGSIDPTQWAEQMRQLKEQQQRPPETEGDDGN